MAVDTATNQVYVNHRTYVAVFNSAGNPIEVAGKPLMIGKSSLLDGYGAAFDSGRLYVADAAAKKIKVYEPAVDTENPVLTISGPQGKFNSLRDAALAVDRVKGKLYVTDNLQPDLTEKPEANIDVYTTAGTYLGHLKYNVVNALPVGLAVDNSLNTEELANKEVVPTQGRVYVTSGNTDLGGIYIYPPGAATTSSFLPPTSSVVVSTAGSGTGTVTSGTGDLSCADLCSTQVLSGDAVELTANPAPGSSFVAWSGESCAAAGPVCEVTATGSTVVRPPLRRTRRSRPRVSLVLPAPRRRFRAAGTASPTPAKTRSRKHRVRRKKRRHRHRSRGLAGSIAGITTPTIGSRSRALSRSGGIFA